MHFKKWINIGIMLMIAAPVSQAAVQLPARAGLWARPAQARTITADSIFAYMDGAGELYIGYRFDRLEVYEYTAADEYDILVEIYYMAAPEDAFGLLSLDWGGEVVDLGDTLILEAGRYRAPARALYGSGLLRLWCGAVYARIMAYNETQSSRSAVLYLAAVIARQLQPAAAPALLNKIPEYPLDGCRIPREYLSFLRSYLVLNSLYYLSEENILNLNLDCAAVMAKCQLDGQSPQPWILLLQYPDALQADAARQRFSDVFLPEMQDGEHVYPTEEGWCGYRIEESMLSIVFAAPDKLWAEKLLNSIPF